MAVTAESTPASCPDSPASASICTGSDLKMIELFRIFTQSRVSAFAHIFDNGSHGGIYARFLPGFTGQCVDLYGIRSENDRTFPNIHTEPRLRVRAHLRQWQSRRNLRPLPARIHRPVRRFVRDQI